ncbi:hypothetical protein JKP88DRAFT_351497, partial [Tribonema minus]
MSEVWARLTQEEEELTRVRSEIADLKRALDASPFAPLTDQLSSQQAVQERLERLQARLPTLRKLAFKAELLLPVAVVWSELETSSQEEKFLKMKAWGQPLKLVASCPGEDIIFLQGKKGTAVDLTSTCHLLPTMRLKAVAFPLVSHGDRKPVMVDGFVSAITPSRRVALGVYHAATPTLSGGVVLD